MRNSLPEQVADKIGVFKQPAHDCGCMLNEPFLQLSFLIPSLKITDRGIIDVEKFLSYLVLLNNIKQNNLISLKAVIDTL